MTTIAAIPARLSFDPTRSTSAISTLFVSRNPLPQTANLSANVTIPSPFFSYTTSLNFHAEECPNGFDAVLGQDFRSSCVRSNALIILQEIPRIATLTTPAISLPHTYAFPSRSSHSGGLPSPLPALSAALSATPAARSVSSAAFTVPLAEQLSPASTYAVSSVFPLPPTPSYASFFQSHGVSELDVNNPRPGRSVLPPPSYNQPSSQSNIEQFFRQNIETGIRCSPFTSHIGRLQQCCALHGIDTRGFIELSDLLAVLLYHVVSGECFSSRHQHQADACRAFSADYDSSSMLSVAVLDIIATSSASQLSTDRFRLVLQALNVVTDFRPTRVRAQMLRELKRYRVKVFARAHLPQTLSHAVHNLESLPRLILLHLCNMHGITVSRYTDTVANLRNALIYHLVNAECYTHFLPHASENTDADTISGCRHVVDSFQGTSIEGYAEPKTRYSIELMKTLRSKLPLQSVRKVLDTIGISYEPTDKLRRLQCKLREYIEELEASAGETSEDAYKHAEKLATLHTEWPQTVPQDRKHQLVQDYKDCTSYSALRTFTCASCAADHVESEANLIPATDIDLSPLTRPDFRLLKTPDRRPVDLEWLDPQLYGADLPCPLSSHPHILLSDAGIIQDDPDNVKLKLCNLCLNNLRKGKTPPLSLANHTFLGDVQPELQDLTVVEEAMISRCRAKSWIIQLNEQGNVHVPTSQRGLKGHIIIFPQRPTNIAKILPPSVEDLQAPICVIFVGSRPPTQQWLETKAKPLTVRPAKVRQALIWLQKHNHLYKDVTINMEMLNDLPAKFTLPVHVEHVLPHSTNLHSTTSAYDPMASSNVVIDPNSSEDVPFTSVIITDVDGNAPANELRAAAIRHMKKKGSSYIPIGHDEHPVNEFFNPDLFPMIYPTLFPYGIGGFEDVKRSVPLSLRRHVKHLLNLTDRRFQQHYSFAFTAFNILQRREVLLRTSVKVKKENFAAFSSKFASVSSHAVHNVAQRVALGGHASFNTADEMQVIDLMHEVNLITSHVPGSAAAKTAMHNEIRATVIDKGLPSFFITINPVDVYNPIVKFLGGQDFDMDNMLPSEVPKYWDQSILVANNPSIAAKFFSISMKAFISKLLRYDPNGEDLEGGILGVVKSFYGCAEAQGRGTLHCHMLIWLEGALNPDEIKRRVLDDASDLFRERLVAYLDDTISNSIPADTEPEQDVPSSQHHPCSVRGLPKTLSYEDSQYKLSRQKDLHNLIKQCQTHSHTDTCYKYHSDPKKPKECRFNLDAGNTRPETTFNDMTGEINLRCLDGLVNNFNETIIEAIRCNMDIKFIGSGASAKAVLYYITNYITKSQLKTHVAFAALERAVIKLEAVEERDTELTIRAKKLLQKCAYSMISEQELSAPQVCSYLLDFEDHFTPERYAHLYWASFENLIESERPSPECSPRTAAAMFKTFDPRGDAERQDDSNTTEDEDEDQSEEKTNDPTPRIGGELPNEDDVQVGVQEGHLYAKATQVDDYRFRAPMLQRLCLWDMIARMQKIALRKKSCNASDDGDQTDKSNASDSSDESDVEDLEPRSTQFQEHVSDSDSEEEMTEQKRTIESLLRDRSRARPKFEFLPEHRESESHLFQITSPNLRRIPVPVGTSIPRRDREVVWDRYCRLMLIFFKPWQTASDLIGVHKTWPAAFQEFLSGCPTQIKQYMNNMQILHECKSSADDHFQQRSNQRRDRTAMPSDRKRHSNEDTQDQLENESEILDHLMNIQQSKSENALRTDLDALLCIEIADESGMFNSEWPHSRTNEETASDTVHVEVDPTDDLEARWEAAYAERRREWKKKAAVGPPPMPSEPAITNGVPAIQRVPDNLTLGTQSDSVRIPPPLHEHSVEHSVDVEQFLQEYHPPLNKEQARAFRIVANHSVEQTPSPLRMYLGGPGGTGKSHVINALKTYFDARHQSRRFRLASYTGIAAKNISGMTLHSALTLNTKKQSSTNTKSHRDLIAMWEGVDYLFIDEVSMLGCAFLTKISKALSQAKQKQGPFGGMNMIFAGDFAQLGPVGETRLYSHIKFGNRNRSRSKSKATPSGQAIVFGKLLWLSVTTVVILDEIMRQSGPQNQPFVELLSRLRNGRCTDEDYALLMTREISNATTDWSDAKWRDTRALFRSNQVKDMFNEKAALAFARRTGRQLHWYYATDTNNGQVLQDQLLREYLETLDSGRTNYRLGRIPLVIGMPVMISHNFDVAAGVVNGSTGTLKSVRYKTDSQGRRHAISCVIKAPDTFANENLPSLGPHEVVALQDTVTMSFEHPYSHKKCSITRSQVPIVPAFSMTVHKAQGQTLESVIVDLQSSTGTESPYVAISRVTTLDGLLILQPFEKKKICCRQSEDVRKEWRRLRFLQLQTIVQFGNAEEMAAAREALANTYWVAKDHVVGDEVFADSVATDTLKSMQARIERLVSADGDVEQPNSKTRSSNSSNCRRMVKRKVHDDCNDDGDNGATAAASSKRKKTDNRCSNASNRGVHPSTVSRRRIISKRAVEEEEWVPVIPFIRRTPLSLNNFEKVKRTRH